MDQAMAPGEGVRPFDIPQGAWHDIELKPPTVLSGPDGAERSVRCRLSSPYVLPLSAAVWPGDALPPELEAQEGRRLLIAGFGVHFNDDSAGDMSAASVSMVLTRSGASRPPFAKAITPSLMSSPPAKRATQISVTISLGVLEISLNQNHERTTEESLVKSSGRNTGEISWTLRRTSQHRIAGSFDFAVLIDAPMRGGTALISLSANARRRGKIFGFRGEIPEDLAVVRLG